MNKKQVIEIINNWYCRKLSKEDVLYGTTVKKLIEDIENFKGKDALVVKGEVEEQDVSKK